MSATVSDKGYERVAWIECWTPNHRLGSANTLVAGTSRAEGACGDLFLRPGLGVEVQFTPRGRPPVRVLIPVNNLRAVGLLENSP